jgi:ketosteroid isomerase-like protein
VMASTNLDLVRSIFAAWERGDYSSAEWAHPEIEYVIADGPAPGSWKGVAAMAEAWRDFLSGWEDVRAEVDEYRRLRAKTANLFHIRGGKVERLVLYFDRARALADLGLTSQAEHR